MQGLLHTHRDSFEISSGQATVGGVAFGQDQQVFFLLCQYVVVRAEESADVRHPVFFGGHGATVA